MYRKITPTHPRVRFRNEVLKLSNMDPLKCAHPRCVIDNGFKVCIECGMELRPCYVENGDQEKTKKTEIWKKDMFGTTQPDCVVLLPSVPDQISCGTCVVNKMRTRLRLVNLAIAFCKIDLFAKGRNRKRDELVASLALLYRECNHATSDAGFVNMVRVSPNARVRDEFVITIVTRINNRLLPLRTAGVANSTTLPLLSQHIFDGLLALLKCVVLNMTRSALMRHLEKFTLEVESHLRRVMNPTSNSRAIVWTWADLEQHEEDTKRGVRKDLYGELPTWMDAKDLIENNIPNVNPVNNATCLQTFSESFIEALGNASEESARNIESVLCDNTHGSGVRGDALSDLVCGIPAEQLVHACAQFTNDPIPVLRNKKGEQRVVDLRFRCSGCLFGRCSSYMSGGISKAKEIDSVWNQFALTGIVANRLCNLFPSTVDGFERLDVPSAVKSCQLHCGEAFWRSTFVRTRLQGSITVAAVMTHPDGYFLPTLPDNAWHKMSVACTAATLGFYESFVAPVIEECVERCSQGQMTSTKVVRHCKHFTSALSRAYVDFFTKKGNPEVDAVACIRLLQYLRISNDKTVSRTQQTLISKDGAKTVFVPNMPLAFGVQRNNVELINILEETFVNSFNMARYKTEHTVVGFAKILKCINNGVLGDSGAHAAESDPTLFDLIGSTSGAPVSLVSRVPEFVRNASVRDNRIPSNNDVLFVRIKETFGRVGRAYPALFDLVGISNDEHSYSSVWNVPMLACGLFFQFRDFRGIKVRDHPAAGTHKKGYGFDNMAAHSEEMKKSALPPSRQPPKSDQTLLSERLEELDDALYVLLVGKRTDLYEYFHDRSRSSSPTRMNAESEKINEHLSEPRNRVSVLKCLYNLFSRTDATMDLILFLDRCKQKKLYRAQQKLTTKEMICRTAKHLYDSGIVIKDFFVEHAGVECMSNEAQFSFGSQSVSAFLNSPDASNGANWPAVLKVARCACTFHGLLASYSCRILDSPISMCLIQSQSIRPPDSVTNAFSSIYDLVNRFKRDVAKYAHPYPHGRVLLNEGHIHAINAMKEKRERAKYELYKQSDDGGRLLGEWTNHELRLGIESNGYVCFVSSGILHALIVNFDDCMPMLRSECWSINGATSEADAASMYQRMVRFLIDCGTDRFKQKIDSGYQYNRVVVSFLCKVAFKYGTKNEKRAANFISASGICFLSGRLGVYAPISTVVGAQGTSGAAHPHEAFELDEDDLVDPIHVPDADLPSESGQAAVKKSRLDRIVDDEHRRREAADAEEGGMDAGVRMLTRMGNARRRG